MIDDIAFVETLIKRRIPEVTVFQNATADAEAEVDIQNLPGRSLTFVRLLMTRASAAAIRSDPALADRVLTTLIQALAAPSEEPEAVLDLRAEL
ncbi:MAG: hypothetical protein KGJ86_14315 [Chloroflexota bacterium]|nr:hypothetical protein [Chloroflexota bacterium]